MDYNYSWRPLPLCSRLLQSFIVSPPPSTILCLLALPPILSICTSIQLLDVMAPSPLYLSSSVSYNNCFSTSTMTTAYCYDDGSFKATFSSFNAAGTPCLSLYSLISTDSSSTTTTTIRRQEAIVWYWLDGM